MASSKKAHVSASEAQEVSVAYRRVTRWHVAEIVSLAVAFLTSSTVCLCLSYVNFALPDCVLYSSWKCSTKQDQLRLEDGTVWGKKSECYLTQYGQAAAAVTAFILCWFFVFFRPTQEAYFFKKKTAASKLILPSIGLCLIFTVTVFVATVTLQLGFNAWCHNFRNNTCAVGGCSNVISYKLVGVYQHPKADDIMRHFNYYNFLLSAQIFSWLSAFVWLENLTLLTLRCYLHLDFPTYFFRSNGVPNTSYTVQTETDSD